MSSSATVVIPVLNMAGPLEEQLAALSRQDGARPLEVIIADNGSTDHLPQVIERWEARVPGLTRVDASGRAGINHARNTGARAAHGDLLLFCDADDIVEQGWVAGMIDALETSDAAGGRTRLLDPTTGRWSDPVIPRRMTTTDLPPSPLGACCAVRRSVWSDVGGFDEHLAGRAADETEFFWRLQARGFRLAVAPDAVVRYRLPTDESVIRRKEYRAARERVRLLRWFGLAPSRTHLARAELRAWASLAKEAPWALARRQRRPLFGRKVAKASGRFVGIVRYGRQPQRYPTPALPTTP